MHARFKRCYNVLMLPNISAYAPDTSGKMCPCTLIERRMVTYSLQVTRTDGTGKKAKQITEQVPFSFVVSTVR